MKKFFSFQKTLFLLCSFLSFNGIKAEELPSTNPYLIFTDTYSNTYEIKLDKNFDIKNKGEFLEIKFESENLELPITSIVSIGFLYNLDEEAEVSGIIDNKVEKIQVYDLEGRLIIETVSDSPNLKDLIIGKIYVIKKGGHSFKYIRYK